MRLSRVLLGGALFAAIGSCAEEPAFNNSQAALQEALQVLTTMPKCAQLCLQAVVASSPCAITDLECTCNNATMTEQATMCVQAGCTVPEMLRAQNATERICQRPVRDSSDAIAISGIAGMVIALLAYSIRILSKIHCSCMGGTRSVFTDLWWDDLAMTFAMVFFVIPLSALSVPISKPQGLGHDIWTLTPEQLTRFLKILYFDEWIYVGGLAFIKVSLICTYLRLFSHRKFRIVAFVAIGLNVSYFLAFGLASVLQCHPISLTWTRWEFPVEGKENCSNFNALGWTSAAANVMLDFLVLGMPMPLLWRMQLNMRKKLLVMLMFGLGFFTTVTSILRLHSMVHYGSSVNVTWDYTSMGYWSTIETHSAVVCACLPAIRNFIRRYFPKLMGGSRDEESHENNSGPSSSERDSMAPTPSLEAADLNRAGLSGQTAIGKMTPEVMVRPKVPDDEDFIPLEEVRSESVQELWKAKEKY